ncbi:MAG: hypothetical protein Q9166_005490 [cf. Caloplaca sp. 2 TL-2023]
MWARGVDSSPGASEDRPVNRPGHRRSGSEATPPAAPDTNGPTFTPRKLHKAASTTFQVFADSLRSKTQAFYVSPPITNAVPSGSPEPRTPKKSSRRSAIWSSVRSRGSRSARRDKLTSHVDPQTPTKMEHPQLEPAEDEYSSDDYVPVGDVPRLKTEIPDSSLQDDDDVTTPPITPNAKLESSTIPLMPVTSTVLRCEPKQLWPSPHMRLRGMTLVDPVSTTVAKESSPRESNEPLATDIPEVSTDDSTPVDDAAHEKNPSRIVENDVVSEEVVAGSQDSQTLCSSEDEGYVAEVEAESNTEMLATSASPPRISLSRPLSFKPIATDGHRIREKDRRSSQDYKGTFWPAGKVLKVAKRSPTGMVASPLDGEPSHEHKPASQSLKDHNAIHLDDVGDRGTDRHASSKSAHDHLEVQQDPKQHASEASQIAAMQDSVRLPSESYEADTEEKSSSPQASMGSWTVWEDARADRKKRYAQIMDTNPDAESFFGFELNFDAQASLPHNTSQFAQTGAKISSLQNIPVAKGSGEIREHLRQTIIGGSTESSPSTMTKKIKSLSNVDTLQTKAGHRKRPTSPLSSSSPTKYMTVDEYSNDRLLRLKLHDSRADVVLREEGGAPDGSMDFLITSQLDPNDPFEKALRDAPYARRALYSYSEQPHTPYAEHALASDTERAEAPCADCALHNVEECNTHGGTEEHACHTASRSSDAATESCAARVKPLPTSIISMIEDTLWTTEYDNGDCFPYLGYLWKNALKPIVLPDSSLSVDSGIRLSSSALKQRDPRMFGESSKYARYISTPLSCLSDPAEPRELGRTYTSFHPLSERDDYPTGCNDNLVQAPRQRLADVSMLERRMELKRKEVHRALCQFIYRCEQESEDEADDEISEDDVDNEYIADHHEELYGTPLFGHY